MTESPLLRVDNLHVRFPVRAGLLQRTVSEINAVNGVSFTVNRGEAFGIVGESGCGKTTIARAILRLINPSEGHIIFDGQNVTALKGKELAPFRRKVQAIFQDPFSSLNPRKTTLEIIGEPLRVHGLADRRSVAGEVARLLELCELPERFAELYPHEMSGGQRQRVGIARALALNPELIVCDEAVSALDVSIQAQIINLLERLRKELGLTYVFIGHDLSVVRHLCNHVAVLYLGRVMETAESLQLFAHAAHPYTRALLDAVPDPDPELEAGRQIEPLPGEVPSPSDLPKGCVFHTRCPHVTDRCHRDIPALQEVATGHLSACWLNHTTNATQSSNQEKQHVSQRIL